MKKNNYSSIETIIKIVMTASRIIFFASLVLISCDNSNKSLEDRLLARVNDDFLTIDQIDTDIFNELNFNDSVVQIKNYITRT